MLDTQTAGVSLAECGDEPPGRWTASLRAGPLGIRNFQLLSAGQLASTVGDYCYAVALPWLVLSTHGTPVELGGVLACYGIPRAALITVGGSLADRISPRTLMLCSDAGRCLLTALFAIFAATRVTSLAALGPVAALLGAGAALFMPASYAILPSLLSPRKLQAGNALYNAAVQGGALLGPAIGGAVVAIAGPAQAFAIDAASYAVSAASLALIRDVGCGARIQDSAVEYGAAGRLGAPAMAHYGPQERVTIWTLLARERVLQLILAVLVGANFAVTASFEVALPVLSHARFGPSGYGAIMACFGAASVVGTLTAARAGGLSKPAVVSASVFLIAALAVAAVPATHGLPGAATAMCVFGLVAGFGNVIFVTLIQRWAPPAMIGRVMGVVMLGSLGSFPVATAIAGMLARHLGPSPVFVISGTLLALAILAGLTQAKFRAFGAPSRLAQGGRSPARPSAGGREDAIAYHWGRAGVPVPRSAPRPPLALPASNYGIFGDLRRRSHSYRPVTMAGRSGYRAGWHRILRAEAALAGGLGAGARPPIRQRWCCPGRFPRRGRHRTGRRSAASARRAARPAG
jgi:MFS family permease